MLLTSFRAKFRHHHHSSSNLRRSLPLPKCPAYLKSRPLPRSVHKTTWTLSSLTARKRAPHCNISSKHKWLLNQWATLVFPLWRWQVSMKIWRQMHLRSLPGKAQEGQRIPQQWNQNFCSSRMLASHLCLAKRMKTAAPCFCVKAPSLMMQKTAVLLRLHLARWETRSKMSNHLKS